MKLQQRILATIASLVFLALLSATALLSYQARRALLQQTQRQGIQIARWLALSANFVEQVPPLVEEAIAEQMVGIATTAAHFVAVAEANGTSSDALNARLNAIAASTVIDEFWITDDQGFAYLTNQPGYDFQFSPDPRQQPQAHVFWPLLTGEAATVVQEARRREIDASTFKYVGVAGVDQPRIVQVGYNFALLDRLNRDLGVAKLVEKLLANGAASAIWVVERDRSLAAAGIAPKRRLSATLSPRDRQRLNAVLASGRPESHLEGDFLKVAAPLLDEQDRVQGAALVYLEAEPIYAALRAQIELAIAIALAVAMVSILASWWLSRWLTRPILQLSQSAAAIAAGQWGQSVQMARQDELGQLAIAFNRMSTQVQQSFQALAAANSELEQRVAARTAEVQQQRRFLQQIVDTDPNLIFVKDRDERFIFANRALAELYGTTVEQVVGKTELELAASPRDAAALRAINQEVLATGEPKVLEESIASATGETRYLLTIKTPLLRADETAIYLLGVSTDITEQKRASLELARAKAAADAANQAKSEFLANMSHELRTPLNGILGYAQILRRAADLNEHRHGVETIQQSGEHLLALISDVLDFSKIEARKLELLPRDFHLPSFLQAIVELIRLRSDQKGLVFEYRPAADLPVGICADDKRLQQVLLNLLSNAVKFTGQGQVCLNVEVFDSITSDPKITQLNFSVEDTGVGMTAEQLTKIFLPFEQVGSRSQRAEGTGLGLAIARQIVELMGGELHVISQPQQGSRFWFAIAVPRAVSGVPATIATAAGSIEGYSGPRRRLLVVDDNPVNRRVVIDLLAPLGFTVLEAEDGDQGFHRAQAEQPDLILTDVVMPGSSGLELTRRLRQAGWTKPIVASSASVTPSEQHDCLTAGCDRFIPKPVDADQLFNCLRDCLQLTWHYREAEPTAASPDPTAALVLPPAEELGILRRAAKLGDIAVVEQEARRLQAEDARYRVFGDRLLQLAREFDDRAILTLLDSEQA